MSEPSTLELPQNPSEAEMCEHARALVRAPDHAAIRKLAATATSQFSKNPEVLSAVGAMYLGLGKLVEAQSFYVQVSRADPKRSEPFARMGEILLRRGDAQRSQKAFERAFQLGDASLESRQFYQEAAGYVAREARDGNEAHPKPLRKVPPVPVSARSVPLRPPKPSPTPGTVGAERALEVARRAGLLARPEHAAVWEHAPETQARAWKALSFGILTLLLALGATLGYGQLVKGRRVALATQLNGAVSQSLVKAEPSDLAALDERLRESFRLDPRRTETTRIWITSLVLKSLLGERPRGIQNALLRGRELGVSPVVLAYGAAVAAMDDGDVLGALRILLENDALAQKDPYFQLVMAAALEATGVEQAGERYANALQLAPELVVAQLLSARYALLEHRPLLAKLALGALAQSAPDRPAFLLMSRWAGGKEAVANAKPMLSARERAHALEPAFEALAMIEQARQRFGENDRKGGLEALARGAQFAKTPGARVMLGQIALESRVLVGMRGIFRELAPLFPIHAGARTLAVRAALSVGDIGTAENAIQGTADAGQERLLVSAAHAYESLDASRLSALLKDTGSRSTGSAEFSAFATGAELMLGRGYPTREQLLDLEGSSLPFAQLIALDAALDADHLDLAEKWLNDLLPLGLSPVVKVRRARLLRYQGKGEAAVRELQAAVSEGGSGARLFLEYVYALAQTRNFEAAAALLRERKVDLLPVHAWLQSFIDAKQEFRMRARKELVKLRPFGPGSPVMFQALSARTLLAAQDPRAKLFAKEFAERAGRYPEATMLTER